MNQINHSKVFRSNELNITNVNVKNHKIDKNNCPSLKFQMRSTIKINEIKMKIIIWFLASSNITKVHI